MTSHTALSVSIGVLGGIAAALCLGPLSGRVLIWAVFIAWACFFATGGDENALKNTIVCSLLGAVLAWIALLIIFGIPLADALTLPIRAGIVIGVTVLVMCLLAQVGMFSTLPASVLGYASVAGFALQTPNALSMGALTSVGFDNALVVIGVSLIVGALLGMVSGKVSKALAS